MCRREAGEREKRNCAGDDGKVKRGWPLFPPPTFSCALSIFRLLLSLSGYPAEVFAKERVTTRFCSSLIMRLHEDLSIVLEIQNWGENLMKNSFVSVSTLSPGVFPKKMGGAPAPPIFFL